MRNTSKRVELDKMYEIIWKGSYPDLIVNNINWETYYSSYLQSYIERDIKELGAVKNELDFLKFLKITG